MISELFAAVAGREVFVQEPVMTWNLFLTAFLVPVSSAITAGIIIAYINRKHKEKEIKENKMLELQRQIDEERLKTTTQWRENHSSILCRVKEHVDNIHSSLDKKVDKEDCDRLMAR